jgi:hypothetical protein
MKYFQEVTAWSEPNASNHIYYLKDDKSAMVGYIKVGTKSLFKFKNPIRIDTRGRKFVELKTKGEPDEVYFGKKEEPKKDVIEVQGSNGKVYQLEKVGSKYTCTCPGFTFRHTCKHVTELNNVGAN